jgi:signal transduction histidine kinase
VFEPFFRGGTEAARTRSGAGLGLAIARAIVEADGGRIWLADSPRGTRVRFSLRPAD